MNIRSFSAICALSLSVIFSAHAGEIATAKNHNEFAAHLQAAPIAVVEFYSPTCSHCITFNKSGTFEALAKENRDVQFVRVSYHEAPMLFGAHKVNAFPTFLVFKNGQEVKELRQAGGLTKTSIQDKINKAKK
ncbi:MAG TPA: thioredoxin family protein [Candidatus Babeliales bacterium]|nr:thioredoxin family protein [Candidatus Babeliales bacterium]